MIVGLSAVLIVLPIPQALAEIHFFEDFESLEEGNLDKQNGWLVERGEHSESALVQDNIVYGGSFSAKLSQDANLQMPSSWIARRLELPSDTTRLRASLWIFGRHRRSMVVKFSGGENPWTDPFVSVRSYASEAIGWNEIFSYQGPDGRWNNSDVEMTSGVWWQLKVEIDIIKGTYSFYVTPVNGKTITVARDIPTNANFFRGAMPLWILIDRAYGASDKDVIYLDDIEIVTENS